MDTNTLISRNKDIVHSYLDDNVVMMNIEKGNYYKLNDTGTKIWEVLESGEQTIDSLADLLAASFVIDKDMAIRDTIEFVEKSLEQDLVKAS